MESTPQEDAEGRAIVQVLAEVLERLVAANAHLAAASPQVETKFHALRPPAIGIRQYLERIHKYASCSKECFVLGLVYIDRLIRRDGLLLTDRCAHRVVVTAVLLAAKFFDDAYYNNAYYARVGGVLTAELNALECEFLFRIDFSLRVTSEVFEQYHAELLSHTNGMRQAVQSHPLSYAPLAPQTYSQSEIDPAVYSNPAPAAPAPLAQAPVLRTYFQSEVDPALYSTPALAAPVTPEVFEQYHAELLSHASGMSQAVQNHPPSYAPSAPQTYFQAEIDPAVYSNPAPAGQAPLAQAPVLRPYSQSEVDPALYSTPALVAPQDGFAASRYPIDALRHSVTSSQTSGTAGLAPGYSSFPALLHEGSVQEPIQAPPMQYTMELDFVYPTLAGAPPTGAPQDVYPNEAQLLGATSSMPQANFYAQTEAECYIHTSTMPSSVRMDDTSPSRYAAHRAMAAAPAPLHSHHADHFARHSTAASSGPAPGTAWRPSAPPQSHPEITPSPHPPRPPIALQHVADCHLSHYQADDALWSSQRPERVFSD